MRKIDADSIRYENHNGVMMVSKDYIDNLSAVNDDDFLNFNYEEVRPKTRLAVIGFRTRCEKCGFEKVFDSTDISDYNFCEKCGAEIVGE